MSKGIYKYTDLKTGEIVYIGKDSNMDKNKRYIDHSAPSKYDEQPFNRILQNNPDRYEYGVIWATEDCTTLKLNKMEILFGKIFNPKFNFGKYGSGGSNGHTEETRQKISESKKGKEPWNKGKCHSKETKINMSKDRNTSGYLNVYKQINKECTQGYTWVYQYYKDGKRKNISSTNINILEEKVKTKGLPWKKFKEEVI